MIEFGKTLRQAREAKGLSLEQLSETTHIVRAQLEALEHEKFDIFAAPVYIRGYIKIICGEFGIDPKPLIDECMEILNGNREPDIKERPIATESEPESAAAPTTEAQPLSPIMGEQIAVTEEPTEKLPQVESAVDSDVQTTVEEPIAEEPPPATISMGSLFNDEHNAIQEKPMKAPVFSDEETIEEEPETPIDSGSAHLSRYAAPIREYSGNAPTPGGRYLRLGILLAVVIAGIYFIFIGIRALYRVTTPEDAEKNKNAEVQKIDEVMHSEQKKAAQPASVKPETDKSANAKPDANKPAADKSATKRTPQKIPSLYID